MIQLSKQMISDYIFCPHKFKYKASNYKYNKNSDKVLKLLVTKHKENLTRIASIELKENIKLSLGEYRTRFTNEFFNNKIGRNEGVNKLEFTDSFLDDELLTVKLNNFYNIFSKQAFIGYNIPVEIPISGTNIVYASKVDFGLVDDEKNLTFIDLVDMKDPVYIKDRVRFWSHYYTVYSYLAASFNATVKVVLKDPEVSDELEFIFPKERFDDDYKQLCELLAPIQNNYSIRNINACSKCEILNECFNIKAGK